MRTTSRNWRTSCRVRLLQHVPCSAAPPPSFLCIPRLPLTGYNDTEQENNKECNEGQYFLQEDTEEQTKEACRFNRDLLSLCSGLSDTNFGYSEGKPCVLLKMNRVKPMFRRFARPSLLARVLFANFCLCPTTDHRPDAPWGPLHQLHDKGEQALRRRTSRVTCFGGGVFSFINLL